MLRGQRPGAYGFWDDFQDEIESVSRSLAAGGGARYELFSKSWFGFRSGLYGTGPARVGPAAIFGGSPFGIPRHELQKALGGPIPHPVTFTSLTFFEKIIDRIKNAANWKTLDAIARPLLGTSSFHSGILYGLGESLVKDVASLLGLAKLVVLAGIYERIQHPVQLDFSDPMTLALTVAPGT